MLTSEAGPLFQDIRPTLNGHKYVARTMSTEPTLAGLAGHLVKIGSTADSAVGRIAGTAGDPTFLMAEATIAAEYETRGVAPRKIEGCCTASSGAPAWTSAFPTASAARSTRASGSSSRPGAVKQAVGLIATRGLHLYRYDVDDDRIVAAGGIDAPGPHPHDGQSG